MTDTLPFPVAFHESDLAGKRLLVVDDDEAMLGAVCKVLRHAGADVTAANGVVDAIERMAEEDGEYDAALTDLRMQEGSGKSILIMIKSTRPDVPVLVMSAFWTEEMKEECTRLGADNLLEKPLRSWHLLGSVARAMMGPAKAGRSCQ
jgi:DNA-binding NtrC family response regulator